MDKFVHDGSEIDDRILADWFEDTHRLAEAEEVRELIDSGQEESNWCYEYAAYAHGGVGGFDTGIGGVGGGGVGATVGGCDVGGAGGVGVGVGVGGVGGGVGG